MIRKPLSLFVVALLACCFSLSKAAADEGSTKITPCQNYLDLSDEGLFKAASGGKTIGEFCRVKHSPSASCEYHVMAKPSEATGYDGWPRTYDDRGRGCVYHPTGKGKCLYGRQDYRQWDDQDRDDMCAGNYVQNAAVQLRHAIINGACGGECSLPKCGSDGGESAKPYCYHCRKCKGNYENCQEGYKFCNLCMEECTTEYNEGEKKRGDRHGDEL